MWARAWEPEPDWQPLRGGPSGQALWRVERPGGAWVVKRLARPQPDDPAHLGDPTHPAWWRREADVAGDPRFVDGPGVVPAPAGDVQEDDEGLLVWVRELVGQPPTGLQVARCLGRFAAAPLSVAVPAWAARDQLRTRLALAEQRGGWRTLARTTLADVTDELWRRRAHWLARLDVGPQGRVHGDAVPSNLLTTRDEDVVATDWQCAGVGPVGADLGYWALSSREDLEVLLEAFVAGAGRHGDVDVVAVTLAARVTATYSVLSRAEWALAQVAPGEGALAGKLRHPAVAPYLRAVQRQLPQLEALL